MALEWVMKGSNTGSMMGFPPTGLPVTLPGAAFIRVEGDKIRSAQGYFDSAAVARGLGEWCSKTVFKASREIIL